MGNIGTRIATKLRSGYGEGQGVTHSFTSYVITSLAFSPKVTQCGVRVRMRVVQGRPEPRGNSRLICDLNLTGV